MIELISDYGSWVRVNLNHLRVFAAVADEGNLTKAAKKLSISQPAVSVQLAELEAALGSVLVHRHSRGAGLQLGPPDVLPKTGPRSH